MGTLDNILKSLYAGKPVNLGPYYTPSEMKTVLANIRSAIPSAWVKRSSLTNAWIVYPK